MPSARESGLFCIGDVVRVVKVRPHLQAVIGEIAIVVTGNYPGTSEDLIDVFWKQGNHRSDGLFADQFASVVMRESPDAPMEDTREYLNAITDGTNV